MALRKRMMKKSKLVILDANVVINSHALKYWDPLTNRYEIYLPATVLHEEAFYFGGPHQEQPILLQQAIERRIIQKLEASLDDDRHLQSLIIPNFVSRIDPGEREALALLKNPKFKDFYFCTGDALPIQLLSVLGLANRGISVEKLLQEIGITKKLERHFTDAWFKQQLTRGFQEKHLWLKN